MKPTWDFQNILFGCPPKMLEVSTGIVKEQTCCAFVKGLVVNTIAQTFVVLRHCDRWWCCTDSFLCRSPRHWGLVLQYILLSSVWLVYGSPHTAISPPFSESLRWSNLKQSLQRFQTGHLGEPSHPRVGWKIVQMSTCRDDPRDWLAAGFFHLESSPKIKSPSIWKFRR